MKYLILGCGPAGIAAAKAARGKDKKADIVILTEEKGPPYLRPLLTDLIMGQVDLAGIADPQAKTLAELGIDVRHEKKAAKVDSVANRVVLADGTEEPYDALLVATWTYRLGAKSPYSFLLACFDAATATLKSVNVPMYVGFPFTLA